MFDLLWGLVVLTTAALGLFRLLSRSLRSAASWQRSVVALVFVTGMIVYGNWLWQNPLLATILPVSNLMILGNWFPLFLAGLAACVWSNRSQATQRRLATIGFLLVAGVYSVAHPFSGQAPRCGDELSLYGDCQQTTEFTCSAASATTLLRRHGIVATEQEMADLCFTRKGTSWLGLYRGLKLKTAGTPWDVEVVQCDVKDLKSIANRPLIAEVGLDGDARVDAAFRAEYGWQPGLRHSVIFDGFDQAAHAKIVDPTPMIGHELWDPATLKVLWRGYGMRLVERK